MSASSLVYSLLSGQRSESTHDDISRAMWTAWKDDTLVENFIRIVLDAASTGDIQQPELLTYINTLDNWLRYSSQDQIASILHLLGAQSIEKLIHLVTPKQLRIDFMAGTEATELGGFNESLDKEETPPANNLSRVDEKSICVEHEEEKEPWGLDNVVRVTTATALARMGYCKLDRTEESIRLLQSRICSAVNDFVASFMQISNDCASLDMNKRIFRLEMAIATPENEEFVATLRYTKQVMVQRQLTKQEEETTAYKRKLEVSIQREKCLQDEKNGLRQQHRTQTLLFQRDLCRAKKNAEQDSRQLVGIHATERAKAEAQASQLSKQADDAARQIAKAESHLQACQTAEAAAIKQVQESQSRIVELSETVEKLNREVAEQEAKASEFEDELKSSTVELETMDRRYRELEAEIHSRDDQITNTEESNEQLRTNLEDLFADMVSLAQIFQEKEKDEVNAKSEADEKFQDAISQLETERRRTQNLQESEKKLRSENEKLYEKAKKYKKLLEAELEKKKAAEKRKYQAPVSYINQLHTSGVSDKSSLRTSRSSRSESQSLHRSASRHGKENDVSSSSSSYRKRYH